MEGLITDDQYEKMVSKAGAAAADAGLLQQQNEELLKSIVSKAADRQRTADLGGAGGAGAAAAAEASEPAEQPGTVPSVAPGGPKSKALTAASYKESDLEFLPKRTRRSAVAFLDFLRRLPGATISRTGLLSLGGKRAGNIVQHLFSIFGAETQAPQQAPKNPSTAKKKKKKKKTPEKEEEEEAKRGGKKRKLVGSGIAGGASLPNEAPPISSSLENYLK